VLEGGDEVEGFRVAVGKEIGGSERRIGGEEAAARGDSVGEGVELDVAGDGGLDAAEGEVGEGIKVGGGVGARSAMSFGLDLGERERDGARVAVGGECGDPGSTGIAEAKHLGGFVEGLPGGVVNGAADIFVGPEAGGFRDEVEVGVTAGDDEGQGGELERRGSGVGCEQRGVDVTLEVVDGDEGLVEGEGHGFGAADADEQGAGESGTFCNCDCVNLIERDAGFGERPANDGDDVADVFARGDLGDDSSIEGMLGDLGGDDVGEDFAAGADDGGCGFVAGGLDRQNEAG
jgi:hypothetical protein